MRREPGPLLLGIWLIAKGLIPILHIRFTGIGILMACLAIAAGILLLRDNGVVIKSAPPAQTLLGIWLITTGGLQLAAPGSLTATAVVAILAIVTGVLIVRR